MLLSDLARKNLFRNVLKILTQLWHVISHCHPIYNYLLDECLSAHWSQNYLKHLGTALANAEFCEVCKTITIGVEMDSVWLTFYNVSLITKFENSESFLIHSPLFEYLNFTVCSVCCQKSKTLLFLPYQLFIKSASVFINYDPMFLTRVFNHARNLPLPFT